MHLVTMSRSVMMPCRRSSSPRIGSDPTPRSRICWAACCSVSCSPIHVAPVCMMSRAVVITYPLDPGGASPCRRMCLVACSWTRPPGRPQDPRQHVDCLGNASTCTSSCTDQARRGLPPLGLLIRSWSQMLPGMPEPYTLMIKPVWIMLQNSCQEIGIMAAPPRPPADRRKGGLLHLLPPDQPTSPMSGGGAVPGAPAVLGR